MGPLTDRNGHALAGPTAGQAGARRGPRGSGPFNVLATDEP